MHVVYGSSDTCTCMFYDMHIWLPVIGASWGSEERNGTDCNN